MLICSIGMSSAVISLFIKKTKKNSPTLFGAENNFIFKKSFYCIWLMKNGGIEFVPPGLRFMVKMRLSSKARDVKPICTNLRGSWAFFQSRFPLIKCPDRGGNCLITLVWLVSLYWWQFKPRASVQLSTLFCMAHL